MTKFSYPDDLIERIPPMLYDLHREQGAVLVGHIEDDQIVIADIWPTENMATDPADAWHLGKSQWRKFKRRATREAISIVGFVHSHPPPLFTCPSTGDMRMVRSWVTRRKVPRIDAIYHIATEMLTWYNHIGIIRSVKIRYGSTLKLRLREDTLGYYYY